MSYQKTRYVPDQNAMRACEPTHVDPGANGRLIRARKEWLGFRPVDRLGNLGPLVVAARGEKRHVNVHPAELFRRILNSGAVGIVLVHNHPSGVLIPSRPDFELMENVKRLCKMLGIRLDASLIVGRTGCYTMPLETPDTVEEGRLQLECTLQHLEREGLTREQATEALTRYREYGVDCPAIRRSKKRMGVVS